MNKRLLTVSALAALLAFGAVACSGDDSEQLNGWAKGVCDAAQEPMAKSGAARADTLKVIPGEAPADLQKRLSASLAALGESSRQLADAVDKAGAPKVDDGAKLQQDAVGELRHAAQGYQDAQKKLDGLPTADQAKFADGLRSVGDQVQQLSQQSTQAMLKLQSGALGDAIKKQPGCKSGAPAASGAAGGGGSPSAAQPGAQSSAQPGAPSAAQSAAQSGAPSAAPAGGATPAASGSAAPSASASG